MKRLLYLSGDGLLEPLGFSQVVRVVEKLVDAGWHYDILSMEKRADLRQEDRVRSLTRRLALRRIGWHPILWDDAGGAPAAARNLAQLTERTSALVARGLNLLHARSYVPALAAHAMWLSRGTPWLFDARAYWVDERMEEGSWFTRPLSLAVARGFESQFFQHAAGVVTLTELQARDVREVTRHPVVCIPTCADFVEFNLHNRARVAEIPAEIRARLEGRRVLGVVGSVNQSYLVEETAILARLILERSQEFVLLVLSAQASEWAQLVEKHRIDPARVIVTRAHHQAMPAWLSLIEWGLLLLVPGGRGKRGSMPTKLAEFLASGVRPVHSGCNEEVGRWVRETGSGISLDEVTPTSLESAAAVVCSRRPVDELVRARTVAAGHFSLESGVRRYDTLLRSLTGG